MRRNCYYEYPELHPINRAWTLGHMNAQVPILANLVANPIVKVEGANVIEGEVDSGEALVDRQQEYHKVLETDHPFELNMIMMTDVAFSVVMRVVLECPVVNTQRKVDLS